MKKIAVLLVTLLVFVASEPIMAEVPPEIQQAFDDKQYDLAIEKIQNALKKDKRNDELFYILGQCHLKKHDTAQAIVALEDAVRFNARAPQARYQLGMLLMETGRLEEASQQFQDGLKKAKSEKDKALFQDGLGLYYLAIGDTTQADVQIRLAKFSDPENMTYVIHLADIVFAKGQYAVALTEYKKVLEIDSLNPELQFRIARCYLNQKQFPEALQSMARAIELDSTYYEGYITVGDIYTLYGVQQNANPERQQQLLSQAILHYTKYLELTGDSGRANYYRGKAYFTFNDFDNAVKDFETAMRQGYEKADLMSLIGRSYARLNQYDKAIEFLDRYEKSILQADPNYNWTKNDAALFLERARAKSGTGDSLMRISAREDFQKACELDSTDTWAYYFAGQNEYYLKDYQKAKELYRKSLDLDSNNAGAYLNIGYACLSLKDMPCALAYLDTALQKNPEYTGAYKLKFNIFYTMEMHDSAIFYAQRWKEIEPESCEPERWIGLMYMIKKNPSYSRCIDYLKQYQNCLRAGGESVCKDTDVFVWIAKAYQMNNDVKGAFETVKRGLECNPNHPELKKMYEELEFEIE